MEQGCSKIYRENSERYKVGEEWGGRYSKGGSIRNISTTGGNTRRYGMMYDKQQTGSVYVYL